MTYEFQIVFADGQNIIREIRANSVPAAFKLIGRRFPGGHATLLRWL